MRVIGVLKCIGPQIGLKEGLRERGKGVSYQIMRHNRLMRHPENQREIREIRDIILISP